MITPIGKDAALGDLVEALCALENADEGAEFLREYEKVNPHAAENIGYAAGYCDVETMQRIHDFTGTAHPVFGRSVPTAAEAFELGRQWMARRMSQEAEEQPS